MARTGTVASSPCSRAAARTTQYPLRQKAPPSTSDSTYRAALSCNHRLPSVGIRKCATGRVRSAIRDAPKAGSWLHLPSGLPASSKNAYDLRQLEINLRKLG